MVSSLSIAFMLVTLLVVFGFPIGLTILLYRRQKISLFAVLIGLATFLIVQGLIRIPLLQLIQNTPFYQTLASYPVWIGLFLGATAALFEEGGRWLAYRLFLLRRLVRKNAIAMGIGHGGFEAIYLVGLSYINNLAIALAINNGSYDSQIAPQLGSNMANTIKNQMISLPSSIFLAAGIERLLTIIFQIALSVLVYFAVRYRKPLYFWLAIAIHTLSDFLAVVVSSAGWAVWPMEGMVAVFSLAGLAFVFYSRKLDDRMQQEDATRVEVLP